jgi:methoxymalonate biosynthesis acyl carrier protein
MNGDSAVADRLARIFPDALHMEAPAIDTDLFDTGILDSLAFVELLLRLEQEFGVDVSVDDLELDNFRTLGTIAQFVEARVALLPALRLVHRGVGR